MEIALLIIISLVFAALAAGAICMQDRSSVPECKPYKPTCCGKGCENHGSKFKRVGDKIEVTTSLQFSGKKGLNIKIPKGKDSKKSKKR